MFSKKGEDGVGQKLEQRGCPSSFSSAPLWIQGCTLPPKEGRVVTAAPRPEHLCTKYFDKVGLWATHLLDQLLLLGLQIKMFQKPCPKIQHNDSFIHFSMNF